MIKVSEELKKIAKAEEALELAKANLEYAINAVFIGNGSATRNVAVNGWHLLENCLQVQYSWSCMGSIDSAYIDIPLFILESENPESEMRSYNIAQENGRRAAAIKAEEIRERAKLAELKAKYGE